MAWRCSASTTPGASSKCPRWKWRPASAPYRNLRHQGGLRDSASWQRASGKQKHSTDRDIQSRDADWRTHELPAATLQIADLRQFAAVVQHRAKPDFSMEHDLAVQDALLKASGMA